MRWVMYITWLPRPVCRQYPALYHLSFASASQFAVRANIDGLYPEVHGPGGMQEHLHHPGDLGYSNSFMGNPSPTHGGFGHMLQGTRIGLYPELSGVFLLSLACSQYPMFMDVGVGGYVGGSTALKTNARLTGVCGLVDGYVPLFCR